MCLNLLWLEIMIPVQPELDECGTVQVVIQISAQPALRRSTSISSRCTECFYSEQVFNSSWHSPKMNGLIYAPGNNGAVSPCASSKSSLRAESALKFWHGKSTAQVAKSQLPSAVLYLTHAFFRRAGILLSVGPVNLRRRTPLMSAE